MEPLVFDGRTPENQPFNAVKFIFPDGAEMMVQYNKFSKRVLVTAGAMQSLVVSPLASNRIAVKPVED